MQNTEKPDENKLNCWIWWVPVVLTDRFLAWLQQNVTSQWKKGLERGMKMKRERERGGLITWCHTFRFYISRKILLLLVTFLSTFNHLSVWSSIGYGHLRRRRSEGVRERKGEVETERERERERVVLTSSTLMLALALVSKNRIPWSFASCIERPCDMRPVFFHCSHLWRYVCNTRVIDVLHQPSLSDQWQTHSKLVNKLNWHLHKPLTVSGDKPHTNNRTVHAIVHTDFFAHFLGHLPLGLNITLVAQQHAAHPCWCILDNKKTKIEIKLQFLLLIHCTQRAPLCGSQPWLPALLLYWVNISTVRGPEQLSSAGMLIWDQSGLLNTDGLS